MSGRCRFCGCTEERACDAGFGDGCSWINARRTVCSSCARADAAWRTGAGFSKKPNMTRAFGAGFRARLEGERAAANPYTLKSETGRYWFRGWSAAQVPMAVPA